MSISKSTKETIVSTSRLIIKPLDGNALLAFLNRIRSDHMFSENPVIPNDFDYHEIVNSITIGMLPVLRYNFNPFYTIWEIKRKHRNDFAGLFYFKEQPDVMGKVEIAYFISKELRDKGFASETVSAIVAWSQKEESIRSIIAETLKSNIASIRVLEKNGFYKTHENYSFFYWRKEI